MEGALVYKIKNGGNMELGLDIAIILFVAAFVAGFIDAIAGGGGDYGKYRGGVFAGEFY